MITTLPHSILTLACPDSVGVVAAIAGFVSERGCSIVESGNFSDTDSDTFFMRVEMTMPANGADIEVLRDEFTPIAERFQMRWTMSSKADRKRIALLVSKDEHCLYDLLSRTRSGELAGDVVCVISNHNNLHDIAGWHNIDFHHIPMTAENRSEAFDSVDQLLQQYNVDVVVLARFMQIFPAELCEKYAGRMINIHHSFLPSFKGSRPYHQAHDRGVKLIGATCHYVTDDLDEGPIIEQDVIRIEHSDNVASHRRSGKDIEKAVLARGLRWHLEDRVFVSGLRTVVFR